MRKMHLQINFSSISNGWPTCDFGVILRGGNFLLPEQAGVWYLSWTGNATVTPVATKATIINQTYNAVTNKGEAYFNMPANDSLGIMFGFNTNNKGLTNLVVCIWFNMFSFNRQSDLVIVSQIHLLSQTHF